LACERRCGRGTVRRSTQFIHVWLAGCPESRGGNPEQSDVFADGAPRRTQWDCSRVGARGRIELQRWCREVDVGPCGGPVGISQRGVLSAHSDREGKASRNVSARLANRSHSAPHRHLHEAQGPMMSGLLLLLTVGFLIAAGSFYYTALEQARPWFPPEFRDAR